MAVRVGTVGYVHPHWVGSLYPPGTPPGAFLEFYAQHFTTVELALDGVADLREVARGGCDDLRVLVTLPTQWIHLPPGKLPFHPGLSALEELAASGQLAGVRLPLDPRLAPTRDHATRLRRLAKIFADQGLVIDLPGGPWQDPSVLEWLERIAVANTWHADPLRPSRPIPTGPLGVVRIPAPRTPAGRYGLPTLERLLPGLRAMARGRDELLVVLDVSGDRAGTVRDARALSEVLRGRRLTIPGGAATPAALASG
jgi:uncharacterized protein YecE (DUF72 family)